MLDGFDDFHPYLLEGISPFVELSSWNMTPELKAHITEEVWAFMNSSPVQVVGIINECVLDSYAQDAFPPISWFFRIVCYVPLDLSPPFQGQCTLSSARRDLQSD
jgi:hypothetical protein